MIKRIIIGSSEHELKMAKDAGWDEKEIIRVNEANFPRGVRQKLEGLRAQHVRISWPAIEVLNDPDIAYILHTNSIMLRTRGTVDIADASADLPLDRRPQ